MITSYSLKDTVLKKRKRPKKSSTNAIVARDAFSDDFRKILSIPSIIDNYNTSINIVD